MVQNQLLIHINHRLGEKWLPPPPKTLKSKLYYYVVLLVLTHTCMYIHALLKPEVSKETLSVVRSSQCWWSSTSTISLRSTLKTSSSTLERKVVHQRRINNKVIYWTNLHKTGAFFQLAAIYAGDNERSHAARRMADVTSPPPLQTQQQPPGGTTGTEWQGLDSQHQAYLPTYLNTVNCLVAQ